MKKKYFVSFLILLLCGFVVTAFIVGCSVSNTTSDSNSFPVPSPTCTCSASPQPSPSISPYSSPTISPSPSPSSTPPPVVSSLVPNNGSVGSSVDIYGINFGASQGSSRVYFNGVEVTSISLWEDGFIRCQVPAGATTGPVTVRVNGVYSNSDVTFTVN